MDINGLLSTFPREVKIFIGAFVIVLSVGYYSGLLFVKQTESHHPIGMQENYLGNETKEAVEIMKFKKSPREMLTIIHTHILSMSFIFFLLGGLLLFTKLNAKLKLFLLIEPFISVLVTFGGIYLLWKDILWMRYVVMLSGILMTATYTLSASIVLIQLFKKQKLTS
ncbi:hypothetical protein [Leptobacterium sp. I13]|uniref:hypothetical protein n=1 Tax=Leptobacterium meishanense TaxID=3128904 RepID=UPI0030EC72BF